MKKLFINLLLMLATFVVSHAQTGSLDPNFGNGGISLTAGFASTSVQQSDGKIVVVNMQPPSLNVVRFKPDGSLDSAFGINGTALFPMSNGNYPSINNVIIQPDGKIVIAGDVLSGYTRMFACRMTASGAIDSSFANNGILIHTFQAIDHYNGEVHNTLDGKLLISGTVGLSPKTPYYLKLNLDGSFDNAFGTNGVVFLTSIEFEGIHHTQIQQDGKIVTGATDGNNTSTFSVKVIRLNTDGTFDNSFGSNGVTSYQTVTRVSIPKVFIQNNGSILFLGTKSVPSGSSTIYSVYIVRFLPNGNPDINFGTNGSISHEPINWRYMSCIVAQPSDDKIVVWGEKRLTSTAKEQAYVARFNTNGSFDTEFGEPAGTFFPNQTERFMSGHIATDGGVIAVGYSVTGSGSSASYTRILAKYISCANSITNNPQNLSRDEGTTASFTAGSSSPSATYQWQKMGTTDWEDLNNGGQYSGVQTATLNINNLIPANNGAEFRAISTSGVCADTSTAAVLTVTEPSSISEFDVAKSFTVYPNPARQNIRIQGELPIQNLIVHDVLGRQLLQQAVNNQQKNVELSLLQLQPGIYWVSIVTKKGIGTYKIIKD